MEQTQLLLVMFGSLGGIYLQGDYLLGEGRGGGSASRGGDYTWGKGVSIYTGELSMGFYGIS